MYLFLAVFKTISACLLFGNMQFKQERNSDQATLPDNTVAQQVIIDSFPTNLYFYI